MSLVADDVAVVVGLFDYDKLPPIPDAQEDAEEVHSVLLDVGFDPSRVIVLIDPRPRQIEHALARARATVRDHGRLWVYAAGYLSGSRREEGPGLLHLGSRPGARARHRLALSQLEADVLLVDGRVDADLTAPYGVGNDIAASSERGSRRIAPLLLGEADGALDSPDGVIVSDEILSAIRTSEPATERHFAWTVARCEPLLTVPGADLSAFVLPDGPLPLVAVSDGWPDPIRRAQPACKRYYFEQRLTRHITGSHRDGAWAEMVFRLSAILLEQADSDRLLGSVDAAAVKYGRVKRLTSGLLSQEGDEVNADVLYAMLGRAEVALGEPDAERHLGVASSSADPLASGPALLALGDIAAERGALLDAVELYGQVPDAYRAHADYRIGWVFHALGDTSGAVAAWSRVIELATDPRLEALRDAAASCVERYGVP